VRALFVVLFAILAGWSRRTEAQQSSGSNDSTGVVTEHTTTEPSPERARTAWRERGSTTAVIDRNSTATPANGDLSDILSSRIPGVTVRRSSGTTGSGARIRIRGTGSLFRRSDPLLVIDGVRVDGATISSTLDVGGQHPSRIDDIAPDDIARIEVLRGPASAMLYGADGANGVILVTTRRGDTGTPRWHAHTMYGPVAEVTAFPANVQRAGTNPFTGASVICTLDLESIGGCIPGELRTWNPLERVSPFRDGSDQRHGLSVSGGDSGLTYYLTGSFERENGVYTNNSRQRTRLRANSGSPIDRSLTDGPEWSFTTSYLDGTLRLPQNDQSVGVLAAGLGGYAVDDPENHGFFVPLPRLLAYEATESVHHLTVGLNGAWQLRRWLRSAATVGADRAWLSGVQGESSATGLLTDGERLTGDYVRLGYMANASATASYQAASSLGAASSVGLRYHKDHRHDNALRVAGRLGRPPDVISSIDDDATASALGGYIRQHIAWRDRLFFTASVYGEQERSSIKDGRFVLSPSADVSWMISAEPYFPQTSWLAQLRLRAAYGSTAHTATPALTPSEGGPHMGSSIIDLRWQPGPLVERTREVEGGFDAVLFGGRADLELTYYRKVTSSPLIAFTTYSLPNEPHTFWDFGDVRSRGVEALLHATVVRSHPIAFDITLTGATNSDLLTGGDSTVPIIVLADRVQHIRRGYPVAGYWERPILGYEDANGDGIISRVNCPGQPAMPGGPACEVQLGDTLVYLGSPFPRRELSVTPSVRLLTGCTSLRCSTIAAVSNSSI
jgi:TonB-dependent SusC/RagA subfamily outer membrane receptor